MRGATTHDIAPDEQACATERVLRDSVDMLVCWSYRQTSWNMGKNSQQQARLDLSRTGLPVAHFGLRILLRCVVVR